MCFIYLLHFISDLFDLRNNLFDSACKLYVPIEKKKKHVKCPVLVEMKESLKHFFYFILLHNRRLKRVNKYACDAKRKCAHRLLIFYFFLF